jgi:sulfonate transport system ATP-binding protein
MQDLVGDLVARHRPAVLLVTHDVDEAIRLADRVLVLRDGAFVADVPIELPRPRDRNDPASLAYRADFLAELGVVPTPVDSAHANAHANAHAHADDDPRSTNGHHDR